jgi:hypothetical protein
MKDTIREGAALTSRGKKGRQEQPWREGLASVLRMGMALAVPKTRARLPDRSVMVKIKSRRMVVISTREPKGFRARGRKNPSTARVLW